MSFVASSKTKRRAAITQSRQTAAAGRATVLVVDDDRSVLSALGLLIRTAGYRVRTFSRPDDLLSARIPRRDACVVADIFLPEMNGVELCRALTRLGVDLPYILITGRNDAGSRRLVESSGAAAVLFKPIDEKPLLKAISRAIASPRKSTRTNR
jgi:two-component system response regulator FixJ